MKHTINSICVLIDSEDTLKKVEEIFINFNQKTYRESSLSEALVKNFYMVYNEGSHWSNSTFGDGRTPVSIAILESILSNFQREKTLPLDLEILPGRFYKLRNGDKAEIYSIDNDLEGNTAPPFIHGRSFNSKGLSKIGVWSSKGEGFFLLYGDIRPNSYDIMEEWVEPLDFDWDCLPTWCNNYIAKDSSGSWYCYSDLPNLEPGFLSASILLCKIPKEYSPIWVGEVEKSLHKNPNI